MAQKGPPAPDADEWLRRGRRNLRVAKAMLGEGFSDAAAFHAQQAAELALKALQIFQTGGFARVHDLTKLARDLGVPTRVLQLAADVTPLYVGARYSDMSRRISRALAEETLRKARRIVLWVRRQMV